MTSATVHPAFCVAAESNTQCDAHTSPPAVIVATGGAPVVLDMYAVLPIVQISAEIREDGGPGVIVCASTSHGGRDTYVEMSLTVDEAHTMARRLAAAADAAHAAYLQQTAEYVLERLQKGEK